MSSMLKFPLPEINVQKRAGRVRKIREKNKESKEEI